MKTINTVDSFREFWKQSYSDYGNQPGEAVENVCIAWAKRVLAADKLLSDAEFHVWWQGRGYEYASKAAVSTVSICQSWSKHVLDEAHYEPKPLIYLSKCLGETWYNWLDRHGIPSPKVEEKLLIQCHYIIRYQDLYAEIDNGKHSKWLYYLRGEQRWQSSIHGPH